MAVLVVCKNFLSYARNSNVVFAHSPFILGYIVQVDRCGHLFDISSDLLATALTLARWSVVL